MKKIFSTAALMGGLGNQMFQIAHATAQGLKNGVDSVFLRQAYTPMGNHQPTKYLNNIFKKINFVDNIDIEEHLHEESWNTSNINPVWTKTICFNGYFQSDKNFLGFNENIIDLFSPPEEFKSKIIQSFPKINENNTLSLHIRRGDYQKISNVLPIIDKTYIDECLRLFGNYSHLFIFSDDKDWVKQNLNYPNSSLVEGLDDYEEMWMISMCKNNIISNSSFSWWGSFLNTNKDKKVFTPSVWFGPGGPSPYDSVYEKEHIKVNVIYDNGYLKVER